MHYRRFGKTELQMPVLTCGGMRYQYKWEDVPESEIPAANQKNLEATILRAWELGIHHIETARGYGTSEIQLGNVLPQLPREKMILQTKVFPFATQEEFYKTFDLSLKNLRMDYVDLLSLHGINNAELMHHALKKGGALEAARKLQKDGRARFIGFSTHATPAQIMEIIKSGEFDYVNLHWYFVNDFNWPAIEEAHARDMGVFIISPNDKGGMLYRPPEKLVELCKPLSPMNFNALYCLSRPQVHTLSIGAAKPSDFDEHINALQYYPQAAEIVKPIEARLRAEMKNVLGDSWCKGWWKGIPEYHDIPGEINIWEILRLWTYAKSFDLIEFGKMRYNLLGNAEHWFPGQNAGAFDEPKLRQAITESPFMEQIPDILREAHELLHGDQQKRLSQS